MTAERNRIRGIMMAELIISMTVLGTLFVLFAISLNGFKRLNNYQLVRQRCVSAGQAELDSIAATGAALDYNDLNRLWPGMSVRIDESDGTGQWEDMKLITVTTESMSFNKKVVVRLSRYFLKNEAAGGAARRVTLLQEK